MQQKVIRIGSSAGVTLSNAALSVLGVAIGDHVSVTVRPGTKTIVISRPGDPVARDEEIIAFTKEFIERYRPALEALRDL